MVTERTQPKTSALVSLFDLEHCVQTVVVDARGHMLGRLASILAKQLLNGQQVVSAYLQISCCSQ